MGKASSRKKRLKGSTSAGNLSNPETDGARMREMWAAGAKAQSHDITANAWQQAQTPQTINEIYTGLYEAADNNISQTYEHLAQLRQLGKTDWKIDCKKGCSYCCCSEVSVWAPEVIVIAGHLKEVLTPEEREGLVSRLAARNQLAAAMSDEAKVGLRRPCPLLVDGACSIYSVRPFACRIHHSRDVNACKRFFEGERVPIPTMFEFDYATQPLFRGALSALEEVGCKLEPLWLSEALELALNGDAAEEWCRGENPFAAASKAEYEERLAQGYRESGLTNARPGG